jgi:hypothetical protein
MIAEMKRFRSLVLIFLSLSVSGCDPVGRRLVQLKLDVPESPQGQIRVQVLLSQVERAITIIDKVVCRRPCTQTHSTELGDLSKGGFVRSYSVSVDNAFLTEQGETLPCQVKLSDDGQVLCVDFFYKSSGGSNVAVEMMKTLQRELAKEFGRERVGLFIKCD